MSGWRWKNEMMDDKKWNIIVIVMIRKFMDKNKIVCMFEIKKLPFNVIDDFCLLKKKNFFSILTN